MNKTKAIIIGGGAYNDLGLIRSCGEANMEVVLVAPSTMIVPIYKSKYVSEWIDTDTNDELKVKSTILSLIQGLRADCKVAIYPTGDKVAIFIDQIKDSIRGRGVVPGAELALEALMDKYKMTEIALKSGFNVPISSVIETVQVYSYKPEFPVIVKPLKSAYGQKGDISICHNDNDFEDCCNKFKEHGTESILIQSLIEGNNQKEIAIPGVSHGNGEITIGGIIEKKRMVGNGSTVYATFTPGVSNDLECAISRYMSSTGYKGLFDIEFIKNENGIFFIECNFRNGAYGYALTTAGLNLAECFAEGPGYIMKPLKRIVFMEERSDILYPLKHKMSWQAWLKDFVRVNTFLWWNWRDMTPFLAYYISKVKKVFAK